jgi:hypothetical protein
MKIGDFLKTLSNGRADDAGATEAALKRLEAEKTAAQAEMAAIAARRVDLLIADDNAALDADERSSERLYRITERAADAAQRAAAWRRP